MGIFGGKSAETPIASGDADFADFAEAPEPVPVDTVVPKPASFAGPAPSAPSTVPFGRWWAVHERHSLDEFKMEGYIIAISCVVFLIHFIGARWNRKKATGWAKAHSRILKSEFSSVGFDYRATADDDKPWDSLKEKSLFEFSSYATGRQNIAFVDVNITLKKRFNPMVVFPETLMSFFFDSVAGPRDFMDATIYPFDGKESLSVPSVPGTHELRSKEGKSTIDGFVWAIVSKSRMKELRDERYDLSLTFTKDNTKLPNWLSIMSESAEITEQLLTPELVKAVEAAGDSFDYLIVSDQPIEKPKSYEEATNTQKRVFLRYGLPGNNDYTSLTPLFEQFIRLPDFLVSQVKLRPEVVRKINKVRDEQVSQLKKEADAIQAEERAAERERVKKAKRDQELASLDAKAQKKYLEKEREKEQKKMSKKQTMRG